MKAQSRSIITDFGKILFIFCFRRQLFIDLRHSLPTDSGDEIEQLSHVIKNRDKNNRSSRYETISTKSERYRQNRDGWQLWLPCLCQE